MALSRQGTHPSAQVAGQRVHIRLAGEGARNGIELAHVDLKAREDERAARGRTQVTDRESINTQ